MKKQPCENCGGSGFCFGKRCTCQPAEPDHSRKSLAKNPVPTDTARLDWTLPLLTGAVSDVADLRAAALAAALIAGLDDRAAIDAAMTYASRAQASKSTTRD
ncbi:hypothetical protein F2P44_31190 [Massilia sp. CCM 8695]|uniref:Uncharacterized protein n=1 Tax=Massilia frigida TaxID=2609281 RepID=A0ABX0NIP2_9BURK|nr:hypothetical protein [Massilia frigida]NHZ83699.1 hypothetical protein [Massilia frigida]